MIRFLEFWSYICKDELNITIENTGFIDETFSEELDTLFKDYEVQNTHHENLSKCIECRLPVAEPSGHFLSFEIEKNSPNQECQTCKMFLPSKCSLSAHQRIHKRMPRYVCPECGEGKNNNYFINISKGQ